MGFERHQETTNTVYLDKYGPYIQVSFEGKRFKFRPEIGVFSRGLRSKEKVIVDSHYGYNAANVIVTRKRISRLWWSRVRGLQLFKKFKSQYVHPF